MKWSDWPAISQFIENIQATRSLPDILEVLHTTALDLGYQRIVYGRAKLVRLDKNLSSPADLWERGFPKNWRDTYEKKGKFDPYCQVSCKTMRPANWTAINDNIDRYAQPIQDFINWTVNDLGLKNGTTIPIRTSMTQYSIVSFIDSIEEEPDASPQTKIDTLTLVANYFVNEVTSRSFSAMPEPASLSKREEECLYWLAHGKSLEDIAIILDISVETVRCYVKRVISKLEVTNRTQALAKALSFGLVDISPALTKAYLGN